MHGQNSDSADSATRDSRPYHAFHDPASRTPIGATLLGALADCTGADAFDCGRSLHDAVDLDALDALFRPRYDGTPRRGGTLTFVVHDYRITVRSDGHIRLEPRSEEDR